MEGVFLTLCVFVILQLLGVDGTVFKEALTHKKIIAKGEEVCFQVFRVKYELLLTDKYCSYLELGIFRNVFVEGKSAITVSHTHDF